MRLLPLRRLLAFVAAAMLGPWMPAALAAPCAGFVDVDTSSGFCPNVEWLKNRSVTLGCTTVQYCPDPSVSRVQMAAFLNRLANALTPATGGGIVPPSNFDIDTSPLLCAQNVFDVEFPRLAHGHAVAVVAGLVGPVSVGVTFVESIDNGASWAPVSPTQGVDVQTSQSASVSVILPPRVLAVGSSYRYALRLNRIEGPAVPSVDVNAQCEIKVFFENRNGTSTPFDGDD